MSEILFLTNNDNSLGLYEWIKTKTNATLCTERLDKDIIDNCGPKLIVSYNYKYIIPEDIIEYANCRIINMHISLLPWNRGSSPNLWSFVEDTPKGVTIHELTKGLDKGAIIYQREVSFDLETDTLSSSYNKLNDEITKLFKEHFEELLKGSYITYPQEGTGSYHTMKDYKAFSEKVEFDWTDKLSDFIKKVKNMN